MTEPDAPGLCGVETRFSEDAEIVTCDLPAIHDPANVHHNATAGTWDDKDQATWTREWREMKEQGDYALPAWRAP